jgi:hypothetical protein
MGPDPDPGGPKICGSGGSGSRFGSGTLLTTKQIPINPHIQGTGTCLSFSSRLKVYSWRGTLGVLHCAVIKLTKRKLKKEIGIRTLMVRGGWGGGLREIVGFSSVRGSQRYRQTVGLVGTV